MKTLIAYASSHGCALKCAEELAARIGGETKLVDLKRDRVFGLDAYDAVVIGGSIYAGRIQKSVKAFCVDHRDDLKTKKVGLFVCCMLEEQAEKEFKDNFPADLIARATATGIFGGAFNFGEMNFLEKAMVRKVSGASASVSRIKEDEIAKFALKMRA